MRKMVGPLGSFIVGGEFRVNGVLYAVSGELTKEGREAGYRYEDEGPSYHRKKDGILRVVEDGQARFLTIWERIKLAFGARP